MTIKELAHSIVDSFNENQLKGFVDLFIKSEPAVEDRSIETIMRSLAMDYIHNYSSARYREGINDQIMGYLELGHSYNSALMPNKYFGLFLYFNSLYYDNVCSAKSKYLSNSS